MSPRERLGEYKPLLYTTTVRNPERIKYFLVLLKEFEGQTLTDELATKIIGRFIQYGLYQPRNCTNTIRAKWAREEGPVLLTEEEVQWMLENNPQRHKEAGFSYGWPSRFDTYCKIMKRLGLAYYEPQAPIFISDLGRRLANVLTLEVKDKIITWQVTHPEYEQEVFLQVFARDQRNNPFIKELNDNIPLILLLQTIEKINADPELSNCGISYKELPLLIFWKDNNAEALYQRIKQLRSGYGVNPSAEVIEEICVNEILGSFKKFKLYSIVQEYPDEFVRKMRMTGLISFRGAGRYIDINHNEQGKIDYILSHYSDYQKYTSARAYFDYLSAIDLNLFSQVSVTTSVTDKERLLKQWTETYSLKKVTEELMVLNARSRSQDNVLKFLDAPVRLEFLTALAIKLRFPNVRVLPNYPCDDEGLPTSTAGGGKADIECLEGNRGITVEVTMTEGRTQTIAEVWPIARHLEEYQQVCPNAQCIFVAPSIFTDSREQIDFVKFKHKRIIRPYSIEGFVSFLNTGAQTFYDTAQ